MYKIPPILLLLTLSAAFDLFGQLPLATKSDESQTSRQAVFIDHLLAGRVDNSSVRAYGV